MTTTRTIVDATDTKINLSWKALQRQFFIASLTTKYNVTVRGLQALYKRLDKQYGNTLTEEEKECYITIFCERIYEVNYFFSHYRSLNFDSTRSANLIITADQLMNDQFRWGHRTNSTHI